MCDDCDAEKELPKMSQEDLVDHHVDLITEISHMAREISNLQIQIQGFTHRIEQVELEFESREAKNSGKLN